MTEPTTLELLIARAVCPTIKPWMDDPDTPQDGKCECQMKSTPHGIGMPLCLMTCLEVARRALDVVEADFLGDEVGVA